MPYRSTCAAPPGARAARSSSPAESVAGSAASRAQYAAYSDPRSAARSARWPPDRRRGGRGGPGVAGGDPGLTKVGERGGERAGEVWTRGDRAEVRKLLEPLFDQTSHEALASDPREHGGRRAVRTRHAVARHARERDDLHVGHRAELPDQQVRDPGADGAGADDDGDGRQRAAALELGDPLAERVFELRKAAADEQSPGVLLPRSSWSGGAYHAVRTGPGGRLPAPAEASLQPCAGGRSSGQLADDLRVRRVRREQRVPLAELEVGEVEPGRDDAAHERPGALGRQVRAARKAGALPAAGRHERLRSQSSAPPGARPGTLVGAARGRAAHDLLEVAEHAPLQRPSGAIVTSSSGSPPW